MKFYQLIMIAGALAFAGQVQTQAQSTSYVDYTGGNYFQNFDSLPYSNNVAINTGNPITISNVVYTFGDGGGGSYAFADPIDSSGNITDGLSGGLGLSNTMAGWYGSATVSNKFGAQDGSQTTGGQISFGNLTVALSNTNRALGLLGTTTSGITSFGVQIFNDTGSAISAINLSFVDELWHQAKSTNLVNFGYAITAPTNGIPSSVNYLGTMGINWGFGSSNPTNGLLSANQSNITLSAVSLATPWNPGQSLWLTWAVTNSAGGAQGYGIDNLNFSVVAVPEPSTIALVGLGLVGLIAVRRRK